MKRRGFLAIMGGAAVAGPGAAKQAVTAASKSMSGGVAKLGIGTLGGIEASEGMAIGSSKSHKEWLLGRVSEYKRILSGELTDEEIEERKVDSNARRVVFEIETSGLRSMAESAKFARMTRQDKRLRDERDRFYAKRSLDNYLKELAGME